MTDDSGKSRVWWRLAWWVVLIALEITPALAQQPKPSQIMDQYRAQRLTWSTNIWPYANTLFGILATIEFAWSAAVMLLEGSVASASRRPVRLTA